MRATGPPGVVDGSGHSVDVGGEGLVPVRFEPVDEVDVVGLERQVRKDAVVEAETGNPVDLHRAQAPVLGRSRELRSYSIRTGPGPEFPLVKAAGDCATIGGSRDGPEGSPSRRGP